MAEVDVKVDGRPRGADYVRGTGDLMEGFTSPDTTEYGNQYVDPDEAFEDAIGLAEGEEPDAGDGEEETVWIDELTGEELRWDQLTEDEQAEVYERRLDDEAAEVQVALDDADWETLVERFPQLGSDERFQDEFAQTAEAVAVHLEAEWDSPGAAASLMENPEFLGRVMENEFGVQPRPIGDEIWLELWQEAQPGRIVWEQG